MQVILKEWRSYCDMEGQSLRIETVKNMITGTYVEIGSGGQLIVRKADGGLVQIQAGEGEVLRGSDASGN